MEVISLSHAGRLPRGRLPPGVPGLEGHDVGASPAIMNPLTRLLSSDVPEMLSSEWCSCMASCFGFILLLFCCATGRLFWRTKPVLFAGGNRLANVSANAPHLREQSYVPDTPFMTGNGNRLHQTLPFLLRTPQSHNQSTPVSSRKTSPLPFAKK